MDIKLTFEQVKARYPELLPEIEAQRATSQAKTRGTPFEECDWIISWGTVHRGERAHDLINSLRSALAHEAIEPKRLTLDEMIARDIGQVHVGTLCCKKGRGRWYADFPVDRYGIPDEIDQYIRKSCAEQKTEHDRIDAMSPQEQDAEAMAVLNELTGQAGFSQIQFRIRQE